jgi:hypothetical protein
MTILARNIRSSFEKDCERNSARQMFTATRLRTVPGPKTCHLPSGYPHIRGSAANLGESAKICG